MRKDLNKVLCEHERVRSWDSFHNYRHDKNFARAEDIDDLPVREGMRKRYNYHWNRKEFGENLSALYGAVRKAVGTKYDKFYSELCKNFDKRSVINQHILIHLDQYLEKNVVIRDGKLFVNGKYTGSKPLTEAYCEYYVDPRDNIIKRNKFYRSYRTKRAEIEALNKAKREAVRKPLGDNQELNLIDGVWYLFDLVDLPKVKIKYVKPAGVDLFNASYHILRPRMVPFESLSQAQQKRYGVKQIIDVKTGKPSAGVRDEVDGCIYYIEVSANFNGTISEHRVNATNGNNYGESMVTRARVNKRTASRKELKKVGL